MFGKNLVSGFILCFIVAVNAECNIPINCQPWVDEVPEVVSNQKVWGVSSCGPSPSDAPIRQLETLVLPAVEGPVFVLPSAPPPPPTVISHKCSCSKTVLKPQLYQRIIQVQKNQRFIKKSFKPVVEKIQYCAKPRC